MPRVRRRDLIFNTAADEPVAGAAGGGGLKAQVVEDAVTIGFRSGTDGCGSYDASLTHCENPRDW